VANLLDILASCTGTDPAGLAPGFDSYGQLKRAVADAVVETLGPLRKRYQELSDDPEHVRGVLRTGAGRAREIAQRKVRTAKQAIGLLPA
jgi:tryptophanyl-tRNA synthetase